MGTSSTTRHQALKLSSAAAMLASAVESCGTRWLPVVRDAACSPNDGCGGMSDLWLLSTQPGFEPPMLPCSPCFAALDRLTTRRFYATYGPLAPD